MITIYDLLEVNENASKEEIEKSYQNLILEYQVNPSLSDQENKENEMILNKLKIAYEIVMNDEKRKRYDNDLAQKRAESLIEGVTSSSKEDSLENVKQESSSSQINNKIENNNYQNNEENDEDEELDYNENEEQEVFLTKEEQEKVRKAAENEFKQNLKKAQKYEEEYNQAYNQAYNNYLKQLGYKQKEPLTLKKIKNILIFLIAIILVCFLAWHIPPIKKVLLDLYKNNFIIKSLVDFTAMIGKAILGIFK